MSERGLTILAVDDERTPLEDLARLLRTFPTVHEVECAYDGHDALMKASAQRYDAIFLDVRMPDLDGIELGRVLNRFAARPHLVYVSAYDSAAVDAFELAALDYLLKPVGRARLEQALGRVTAAMESTTPSAPASAPTSASASAGEAGPAAPDLVPVANVRTGTTRLVPRSAIVYVQAQGDFVRIVTDDGRYLLRSTLQEIERRWSSAGFVRVHRQYVANLARAVELRPQLGGTAELMFAGGHTVPIARRHVTELSRRLGV